MYADTRYHSFKCYFLLIIHKQTHFVEKCIKLLYRTRSLLLRWNLDLDFFLCCCCWFGLVFVVSAFISLSFAFTSYGCQLRKQYRLGASDFGFERMWNVICFIPLANSSQSFFNVVSFACVLFRIQSPCFVLFCVVLDDHCFWLLPLLLPQQFFIGIFSKHLLNIINTQMVFHVCVHLSRFANEKSLI